MGKYKNLVTNIGLFGLSTVSTKLITFILIPLYTGYLSKAEFGMTDLGIATSSLLLPMMTLCIGDATMRFVLAGKDKPQECISIGLLVTLGGCLASAAALPLLNLGIFGGLGEYKAEFFVMFVLNVLTEYLSQVARALNKIKLIAGISIISSTIMGGAAAVFIAVLDWGVQGYWGSLIIGYGFSVFCYLFPGKIYLQIQLHLRDSGQLFIISKKMLRYCLPLVPDALLWWMSTSINRFFITGMLGVAATGLFAAAGKIPNILAAAYGLFSRAWQLSAYQEYGSKEAAHFFGTVFKSLNAVLTVCISALIILSPMLASILFQRQFYSAWTLAPLLLVAVYFSQLSSFYSTVYAASMRTSLIMKTTVVGAILCAGLTWLLIPKLGLQGASLALTVSNATVFGVRVIMARTIMKIPIDSFFFTIGALLLSIQAVSASFQVRGNTYLSLCIFFIIAVLAFIALRSDMKILLQRIRLPKK
nr:polysaccharide biosynthesis C-terminal domain-containing protein [Bifidobacterium crudilactis]